MNKNLLFLLLSIGVVVSADTQKVCGKDKVACKNTVKQPCKCYCSDGCGPRQPKSDDDPQYIEDDPNGNYCYCKPRDVENYEPNQCRVKDAARRSGKEK